MDEELGRYTRVQACVFESHEQQHVQAFRLLAAAKYMPSKAMQCRCAAPINRKLCVHNGKH